MPGAGEWILPLQGALPELFPGGKVARPHVVPPPDSAAWLVPGTVASPPLSRIAPTGPPTGPPNASIPQGFAWYLCVRRR